MYAPERFIHIYVNRDANGKRTRVNKCTVSIAYAYYVFIYISICTYAIVIIRLYVHTLFPRTRICAIQLRNAIIPNYWLN